MDDDQQHEEPEGSADEQTATAEGADRGDETSDTAREDAARSREVPEERQKGGVATDGPRGEQESDEEAQKILEEVEENPPADPKDWPGGRAKYLTIGGDNPSAEYEDGPEGNLGPPDLRHHPDGSVTIAGEEVDDPSKYKRGGDDDGQPGDA